MKRTIWMITPLIVCALILSAFPAGAQYVPEGVRNRIQAQARDRYPDNEVLQQRMISLQTRAYFKVQDYHHEKITEQQMNVLKGQAARKFPNSYVSQLTFLDKLAKDFIDKEQAKEDTGQ